jgi:hypothetical protein
MTSVDMDALDEMRLQAKKTAALARAAESLLDDVVAIAAESQAKFEDLAHLVGATAEAAEAIAECGSELELSVNTHDRQEG